MVDGLSDTSDPVRLLCAQEMTGPLPDFWPWTATVWATTDTVKRLSDTDTDTDDDD